MCIRVRPIDEVFRSNCTGQTFVFGCSIFQERDGVIQVLHNFFVDRFLRIDFRLHIHRRTVRIQNSCFAERSVSEHIGYYRAVVSQEDSGYRFSYHISFFRGIFLAFIDHNFCILNIGVNADPRIIVSGGSGRFTAADFCAVELVADARFVFHINGRIE